MRLTPDWSAGFDPLNQTEEQDHVPRRVSSHQICTA
jgi:hypothetical protein